MYIHICRMDTHMHVYIHIPNVFTYMQNAHAYVCTYTDL